MKNIFLLTILSILLLFSCVPEETEKNPNEGKIAYVINYGAYSLGNGKISAFDIENKNISHNVYKNANNVELGSNPQSMSIYNDKAYIMSNAGDKIDVVNAKTLKASVNPISTNIIKPRYFAANGNTAYVSCWGEVNDWSVLANSYIAKIDLTTNTVEKISLSNGPEGIIIVDNKLYTGLTITNKVAVIDLDSEQVSFINVSAIPQHFVKDNNDNILVSLVSTYTVPFPEDSLGIAIIDTKNNKVIETINVPEINSGGQLSISSDGNTLYTICSKPLPNTTSSINTIDIITKTFNEEDLISGESFNNLGISPLNDDIYLLLAPDATSNGTLKVFDKEGLLKEEKQTGIFPQQVLFYDVD